MTEQQQKYTEWIKNRVLLYSTGNYVELYSISYHNGKVNEKEKMKRKRKEE